MNISNNDPRFSCQWEGVRYESYQVTGGMRTPGYGHTQGAKPGHQCTESYQQQDYAGAANALLRWHNDNSRIVKGLLTPGEAKMALSLKSVS